MSIVAVGMPIVVAGLKIVADHVVGRNVVVLVVMVVAETMVAATMVVELDTGTGKAQSLYIN
jgi:hypothetical protein